MVVSVYMSAADCLYQWYFAFLKKEEHSLLLLWSTRVHVCASSFVGLYMLLLYFLPCSKTPTTWFITMSHHPFAFVWFHDMHAHAAQVFFCVAGINVASWSHPSSWLVACGKQQCEPRHGLLRMHILLYILPCCWSLLGFVWKYVAFRLAGAQTHSAPFPTVFFLFFEFGTVPWRIIALSPMSY